MVRKNTPKAVAEVSIYESNGALYLGIEVLEKLQVGYNDKVAISIPSAGETVTGFIDSGARIHVGRQKVREIKEQATLTDAAHGSPAVEAEVEPARQVWEDVNGGAEPRRESVAHNSAQIRNW
jgi:hypothetical protein